MVGKTLQNELDIRDAATDCFISGNFDKGDAILAESKDVLSDCVKLECVGNRFFYKGDYQNAIKSYEEGISLNPEHQMSRYQYLVGVQLEKEGELVESFKRYQAAIEVDPRFVDSYVELGGLLIKVGDLEGAVRCYADAYELDKSDARNAFNLKAVLERLVADGEDGYQEQWQEIKAVCDNLSLPSEDFKW